jgi:thioredoxin 1
MANLDAKLNVIVMLAICFAGYYILTAPKEPIAPPDDAWFQAAVVNQPEPVLVKFGAEWCGPCRMLDPELDQLAEQRRGQLDVVRVNVDQRASLAQHYGVSSIPRLLLFRHGQVVADRVGYVDQSQLQQWVDANSQN